MTQTKTSGIGLSGVLTVVFIILKLVGTIDWSWWWVLSPVWIPTVTVFAVLIFILSISSIFKFIKK